MDTPLPPRQPGAGDYGLLLLLGAIWGASFIQIKLAVGSVPAVNMTVMRLALTAVLMYALLRWLGERLPQRGPVWRYVALSALFGNSLPFVLIAWAEERIDGSLTGILLAPVPLLTVVIAHLATADEKLDRWKLGGVGLGILGVLVLLGLDKLTRLGDDTVRQLAVLAAGCCYAINIVSNRGLTTGSPVANVTAVMLVSLAMLAPLALMVEWSFTPSLASLGAIVSLAVLSTCIGTLLLVEIVRRQGAAFSGQINFLVPMFSVLWGAVLLAERPGLRALAGLALILVGVAIAGRGGKAGR